MSKIIGYAVTKKTLAIALLCSFLAGCGTQKTEEKKGAGVAATMVTIIAAQNLPLVTVEKTLGEIESLNMPQVAAEVSGQVKQLFVDVGSSVQAGQIIAIIDNTDYQLSQTAANAEIKRQEALVANQERLTQRYRELAAQNFISGTKLDETESQFHAQKEQLENAKAQLARAAHTLSQTKVIAPISGKIENRYLSVGDYVASGKPIVQIAQNEKIRIKLPFPENLANKIQVGQDVRMSIPTDPQHVITAKIQEIKTIINNTNRALYALVELANPGGWQAGGSVNAELILGQKTEAIVVPAQSVVLRPIGKVVYVIQNNVAKQRVVQTGEKQDDLIEIKTGLKSGEIVALNGAGFLTDQAKVSVKKEKNPPKE